MKINLDDKNVIHQLRINGFKVKVHHQRYSKVDDRLYPRSQFKYDHEAKFDPIQAKGGKTEVYITTPDGKELKGEALCSLQDAFNRRIALKICLGRIFKKFK